MELAGEGDRSPGEIATATHRDGAINVPEILDEIDRILALGLNKRTRDRLDYLRSMVEASLPDDESDHYLIYTFSNRAYYRPDCLGYAAHRITAGRYTREEVARLLKSDGGFFRKEARTLSGKSLSRKLFIVDVEDQCSQ